MHKQGDDEARNTKTDREKEEKSMGKWGGAEAAFTITLLGECVCAMKMIKSLRNHMANVRSHALARIRK